MLTISASVKTGNRPRPFGRPVQVAAIYTVVLRVVYGIYGAILCGHLYLDPRLVRSNAFTDHLMPASDRWLYATLGVWERFDTLWYVHIAQFGYDRPAAIVFYPLYPLLIRIATWLIHPPLLAALMVSTAASFFFFWGVQELLELDFPRSTAVRAVLFAGAWPGSCILFAGYAEPLVLAFTVWSIYFARRNRWPIAGLLAFFSGASKAVGCCVFFPLAWLGYREKNWRAWTAGLALVPPLAFAVWNRVTAMGSVSDVYVRYWTTTVEFPWVTLAQCVHRFFTGGIDMLFKLNFGALLALGCLTFVKGVRTEYKLYTAGVIVLFLTKNSQPLLNETLRYVLVGFPAFLGLALLVKRTVSLIVLTAVLLLINGVFLLKFFEWSLVV